MKKYNVVDLSRTLEIGMPQPMSLPRLGMWLCLRQDWGDQVNCQALLLAEHVGTNCDAPFHVLQDGATIDSLPADAFMGPAVLVDLRHVAPLSIIDRPEIQAWEAGSGVAIREADIVVLMTGFDDKHWRLSPNAAKELKRRPSLGMDAAEYLAGKGIAAIGMDTGSPDVSGTDLPVHRYLLGRGVLIIESLTNLDQIPGPRFLFIALPLKIRGGSGSPVRAIAVTGDLSGFLA